MKAPSPLLKLPSFDIVRGIAIETMHCVYLGVVKQLVGLWFNSKHSGQKWYCGDKVERVDKRVLEIKPHSVITRIPRSIQHHLKFWKGKLSCDLHCIHCNFLRNLRRIALTCTNYRKTMVAKEAFQSEPCKKLHGWFYEGNFQWKSDITSIRRLMHN